MMKIIYLITAIFALWACGQKVSESNSLDVNKDKAACGVDTIQRENTEPNSAKELALLMRKMESDLMTFRTEMKRGKILEMKFDYSAIYTAEPTKSNLRENKDFSAYANSYLMGVDNLKTAPKDSVPSKYNLLVSKCVDCHNSFCTGPISRIKKLYVNAEKIKLN